MKWKRHDQGVIVSEDGFYSICRFNTEAGPKFEVWRRRAHKDGAALLGSVSDPQVARDIAERDSRE